MDFSGTETQLPSEMYWEILKGKGVIKRFEPDFAMTQSWQRLLEGIPEPHDLTLLKHEIMENQLMEEGMTQDEAHRITSGKYSYSKEIEEFYGNLKKHQN